MTVLESAVVNPFCAIICGKNSGSRGNEQQSNGNNNNCSLTTILVPEFRQIAAHVFSDLTQNLFQTDFHSISCVTDAADTLLFSTVSHV